MIKGLFILLCCQLAGEALHLVTGLPVPGAVIGMVLLLILMLVIKPAVKQVEPSSNALIALLPLLFMPPTVGLAFLGSSFNSQWPAFAAAAILGTILTLILTALLLKKLLPPRNRNS